MLSNGEPRDEIKAAITPDLARAIDAALLGVRNELAPPTSRDDRGTVVVELGRYMSTGGGGWPEAQREEWIDGVAYDLREFPFRMLIDSILRARLRVSFPGKFVSWVVNDLEEDLNRLRREEALIAELREIARS